jgi:hypothetical protein
MQQWRYSSSRLQWLHAHERWLHRHLAHVLQLLLLLLRVKRRPMLQCLLIVQHQLLLLPLKARLGTAADRHILPMADLLSTFLLLLSVGHLLQWLRRHWRICIPLLLDTAPERKGHVHGSAFQAVAVTCICRVSSM